jgi:superfamily II DNA/RNA helicase
LIHDNDTIPVKKRLYMTATPKIFKGLKLSDNKNIIYSMDNIDIFGPVFYTMSFTEAINKKILCDYKIVIIGMTEDEIKQNIEINNKNKFQLMCNLSLNKFINEYNVQKVITFHSSIKKAKDFKDNHQILFKNVNVLHISGKYNTSTRNLILDNFKNVSPSILTNSRCLTEGIDITQVDTVFFCDPKNSKIDIIQSLGRAMRTCKQNPDKISYILLPYFTNQSNIDIEGNNFSTFDNILNVLASLTQTDERLIGNIENIAKNIINSNSNSNSNNFIEFIGEIKHKENLFIYKIFERLEEFMPFEKAREFSRSLKLKSTTQWKQLCINKKIPNNIPRTPNIVYSNQWKGWPDWLNTGNKSSRIQNSKSYDEAKKIVHSLNIKNNKEWGRLKNKPEGIPSAPQKFYKNKGWINWSDFLGTRRPHYAKLISYEEAKKLISELNINIKNEREWQSYFKENRRPPGVPFDPDSSYKNKGWTSWKDFLNINKSK